MSLDELPYGARALVEDPVERRHHDTEGVTEDAAARDARELPVVRDGYGEAVMVVDVQHDMDVRAAIADADHTIRSNPEALAELFDHGHLAVTGRRRLDRPHLSKARGEVELGAVDLLRREDAGEGGGDALVCLLRPGAPGARRGTQDRGG